MKRSAIALSMVAGFLIAGSATAQQVNSGFGFAHVGSTMSNRAGANGGMIWNWYTNTQTLKVCKVYVENPSNLDPPSCAQTVKPSGLPASPATSSTDASGAYFTSISFLNTNNPDGSGQSMTNCIASVGAPTAAVTLVCKAYNLP